MATTTMMMVAPAGTTTAAKQDHTSLLLLLGERLISEEAVTALARVELGHIHLVGVSE